MLREAPQPDHAAIVIQELLEWIPRNSLHSTSGLSSAPDRPFVPLPDLEAYLKTDNRTSKLLHALHIDYEHRDTVTFLQRRYIRVFTILILIGKGRYIEHFFQYINLRDSQLPFLEKPTHFPADPDDPTFWSRFHEVQFTFCAHHFCFNENHIKIDELSVLPIICKEVLGEGGTSAIYKIKLHLYYDHLLPALERSSVRFLSVQTSSI